MRFTLSDGSLASLVFALLFGKALSGGCEWCTGMSQFEIPFTHYLCNACCQNAGCGGGRNAASGYSSCSCNGQEDRAFLPTLSGSYRWGNEVRELPHGCFLALWAGGRLGIACTKGAVEDWSGRPWRKGFDYKITGVDGDWWIYGTRNGPRKWDLKVIGACLSPDDSKLNHSLPLMSPSGDPFIIGHEGPTNTCIRDDWLPTVTGIWDPETGGRDYRNGLTGGSSRIPEHCVYGLAADGSLQFNCKGDSWRSEREKHWQRDGFNNVIHNHDGTTTFIFGDPPPGEAHRKWELLKWGDCVKGGEWRYRTLSFLTPRGNPVKIGKYGPENTCEGKK